MDSYCIISSDLEFIKTIQSHRTSPSLDFLPGNFCSINNYGFQFGSVSIYIGKEEKEVQNLTLRTSVNEVIQALVKENNPQTDNLSADSQSNGEKDNQSQQSNPSSSSSTQKTNEKENWVLVESWRGIERPLPPRTRLLRGNKYQKCSKIN